MTEENLLEPSPMEPSSNKKTPSHDPTEVTNVTNEAANKPSSGSGLRARHLIDLFLCSAMVLIHVMVSPTLTRAAPVPKLVVAKMLEHTKERNAVQNSHPRIETETITNAWGFHCSRCESQINLPDTPNRMSREDPVRARS